MPACPKKKRVYFRSPALGFDVANRMVENLIGVMPVPLGVAVNFHVNGRDLIVPMAIEEPSVIAAASNAAKMCKEKGGFHVDLHRPNHDWANPNRRRSGRP